MIDSITIHGAVPKEMLASAVAHIDSLPETEFDVYKHRFEPKLQVKKRNNTAAPLAEIVKHVRQDAFSNLYRELFDLTHLLPTTDYFTSFYIYRPGDYLQTHIDAAVNKVERKVVTVNLYLTSCEGGELTLGDKVIPAQENTIVAFVNHDDSYHGVSKVTSGRRMMLTTGLCMPIAKFPMPNFTRNNTKAWFVPAPGEQWTDEDFRARDARAAMNWGNM